VAIFPAPMADQPMIQPTMTVILVQVGQRRSQRQDQEAKTSVWTAGTKPFEIQQIRFRVAVSSGQRAGLT
jgi:hypothetical protein